MEVKKSRHHVHKHIHKTLRKHSPRGVRKAKRLVGFRYPKLLTLALSICLAYYIFTRPEFSSLSIGLEKFSYAGLFIAGALYAFGFSAPFGIGFLLIAHPANIIIATLSAGIGATIADMIIFHTIKFSFMNEFEELERKKAIKKIEKIVEENRHVLIRHYLIYIFAGLILVTPLPDEIGVSMLAGLTTIKPWKLAAISFILHSVTVLILLLI